MYHNHSKADDSVLKVYRLGSEGSEVRISAMTGKICRTM